MSSLRSADRPVDSSTDSEFHLSEFLGQGLAGLEVIDRLALAERAAAGALVLVPTDRLVRDQRFRLLDSSRRAEVAVAQEPRVFRFRDWLSRCWDDLGDERALLSSGAEQILWEQLLASDQAVADSELDGRALRSLAASLAEAWELALLWEFRAGSGAESDEVATFRRLAGGFRNALGDQVAITRAELPKSLSPLLSASSSCPSEIVLLGFEVMEPAFRALLDTLAAAGTTVFVCDGGGGTFGEVGVTSALDADQELRTAARAIAERLAAAQASDHDQQLRIGVVACDLDGDRLSIERIFTEELNAAAALPTRASAAAVIDVAGGIPLADQAVVRHALDLLQLGAQGNSFELISRILLAPYPRGSATKASASAQEHQALEQEPEARAQLEAELRRQHCSRIDLVPLADQARRFGASRLASALAKLFVTPGGAPLESLASLRTWLERFSTELNVFGWPGAPGDPEGAAIRAWSKLLEELASLSVYLPELSRTEALSRLGEAAATRRTQIQAPTAPVQVVGLLDAAGLVFDEVWVLGMNDHVVPAAANPSPFLPVRWQREEKVRRGSAEAELGFAQLRWKRLMEAAPKIHVSWRQQGARAEDLGPSSLVLPWSEPKPKSAEAEVLPTLLPWYGRDRVHEFIGCEAGQFDAVLEPRSSEPLLPPPLRRTVSATSWGNVAACPFRGVAKVRWDLDPLESVEVEPCNRTRGQLLHAAMQALHERFPSAEELARASKDQLAACARDAAHQTLQGDSIHRVDLGLHDAVAAWVAAEILDWVEYETYARNEIWETHSVEHEIRFDVVDGLSVLGRVDRIDLLDEDKSLLIIDYKTSTSAKTDGLWKSQRPEDPQMLFYAEHLRRSGEKVAGLAFANLTGDEERSLKGLAARELAKGINVAGEAKDWPLDWDGIQATIRHTVESLAHTYLDGEHAVDPHLPKSCSYCGLEGLCRVAADQGADSDEAADGDQGGGQRTGSGATR